MRNYEDSNKESVQMKKFPYVEILGDTVAPSHTIAAIVISVGLGLGGYLLGEKVLVHFASAEMVQSYSLLAGIIGCVIAVIACALLFKPKRILTETEMKPEDASDILAHMQVDYEEEIDVINHDPVTRKEMEDLKIKDLFIPKEEGKEDK
ncbi:hypothetical protein P5G51_004470 [Virgibacillus sp. 179-BFC.A HS]|uniref:Uncharacterized protein n=1 Tax=Tigheibacillus jepli TaxID=3035914 RepID=A0ABU5CFV2_9BACI|nr:hypothetical protein [Virgibacillus sp. 179-BFC.A HS]MDY0404757.1 hypothetical protein [Virgibacillus sp. 179-BFC.A HS]